MKNDCLITVIVPAYNHEHYILQCLDSIANQTYKEFQWIVVDDGSKDATPQILQTNKDVYGYELIIQKNKGLSQTLTEVLSDRAKGQFICICASDDYWLPNKLEIQLAFMEAHPEYAMCYGKTYNVNRQSELLGIEDFSLYRGGYIFEDIITQRFHPPVNYMIRMDVLREFGFYKSGIIAEDFYMNCLIAHKYPIGYIPEVLGYYRVEELQKKRDPWSLYECQWNTMKIFQSEPIFKTAISLFYLRLFSYLSIYRKYKLRSLKYMCYSLKYVYTTMFMRGVYHFFFKWN